jgi:hypothetical protein
MQDVHSPREQLEVASVGKVYDLIVAALARLPARANSSARRVPLGPQTHP